MRHIQQSRLNWEFVLSEWREVESPKIWVSRFPMYLDLVAFDWTSDGKQLEFINAFKYLWQTVPPEIAPKTLYFESDRSIPKSAQDAFKIIGGVLVISPDLRDVLVQFDIGDTQLFEVPIHADEDGTPSGLPNHYVLNVHAPKETVIPELSENIKQIIPFGKTEPPPTMPWSPNYSRDVLAVRAEAVAGADLWHDPMLNYRFFLSDQLKQAIDAAGLKAKALDLHPARVFEQN